jgi:POT family proton-dependent oligopeptide transporter
MNDSTGSAMTSAAPSAAGDRSFFGHPRGLATLFFTEMWERFSYYGGRGILILFMTAAVAEGGLGMSAADAAPIYGLYVALVYLAALPGGWVADRLLGQRDSVFYGGLLIALGNASLATPGVVTFYLGLVGIVLGTGLLKPNVSAIVGDIYPDDSPDAGARRDAGFSIFYMGINVGALIAPIVTGFLAESPRFASVLERWGVDPATSWHWAFGAASVGMVAGLIQYRLGGRHLGDAGILQEEARSTRGDALRKAGMGVGLLFAILAILWGVNATGLLTITLQGTAQATGVVIFAVAVIFFTQVIAFGGLDSVDKKRVFVIFLLFIGAAIFWAGFEQAASSFNLFARERVDRIVFGEEFPTAWFQSVNPTFIILLAPVFASLWVWLAHRKREPSLPVKFGLGLVLMAAGFFVVAWAAMYTEAGMAEDPGAGVSLAWLAATYFLHTCGELCLSPVGLSSVTKLSPRKYVGQMMGTWFMGAALGNLIAGLVAGYFEILPLPSLFAWVGVTGLVAGLFFFLFSRPIKRMMGGVH